MINYQILSFSQDDFILQLCELSDMVGAIEEYLKKWNLTMI